jgi:hypothetical protein
VRWIRCLSDDRDSFAQRDDVVLVAANQTRWICHDDDDKTKIQNVQNLKFFRFFDELQSEPGTTSKQFLD